MRKLASFLLYKVLGWRQVVTEVIPEKCIICLAPHTSNWDFIIGQLYSISEGRKTNFLMKKEWFFWPLGYFFRSIGGIPVYREKKSSMTDALAESAHNAKEFRLCITPEGTRKANPEWKRGFYYAALKAGIPILLFGLDFERKMIQCTQSVIPSGDIDNELPLIKDYFKGFKGKHPENFEV